MVMKNSRTHRCAGLLILCAVLKLSKPLKVICIFLYMPEMSAITTSYSCLSHSCVNIGNDINTEGRRSAVCMRDSLVFYHRSRSDRISTLMSGITLITFSHKQTPCLNCNHLQHHSSSRYLGIFLWCIFTKSHKEPIRRECAGRSGINRMRLLTTQTLVSGPLS